MVGGGGSVGTVLETSKKMRCGIKKADPALTESLKFTFFGNINKIKWNLNIILNYHFVVEEWGYVC